MSRAVIIGNGAVHDYNRMKNLVHSDDYIICADGGFAHAKKAGIAADIVIGDFDSSDVPENVKTEIYPQDKDYTDGELCLKYALSQGYTDILFLAMTGTRSDHMLENIFLMTNCTSARMSDEYNDIYLLKRHIAINGSRGKTLSLLALNGSLEGITTKGLKYPLENGTLSFAESRGISNVINSDECEITTEKGIGLAIVNDGK